MTGKIMSSRVGGRTEITTSLDGHVFRPTDALRSAAANQRAARERRIHVVVFPGFSSFDAAMLAQTFQYANELDQTPSRRSKTYKVLLVSATGGTVISSSGLSVSTELAGAVSVEDAIVIVGGEGAIAACRNQALARWLHNAYSCGMAMLAVSEGQVLLDAQEHRNDLSRRHSAFSDAMRPDAGIESPTRAENGVLERNAALATALGIVGRDLGRAAARKVGERIVPGARRWLSAVVGEVDESNRSRAEEAARWIAENFERPIMVADVCAYTLMTTRTLSRQFKEVTGMSPTGYLVKVRFDRACQLLVSTQLPIDKIARRCGFSSGMTLAKLFRRRLSASASEYRQAARMQMALCYRAPETGPDQSDFDSAEDALRLSAIESALEL
jgi:transcriptional regulator GlxA family with amidase domain